MKNVTKVQIVLICLLVWVFGVSRSNATTWQQVLDSKFDQAETFDGLQDWDGNYRTGINYGSTYAPKKADGSNTKWVYFSNDITVVEISNIVGTFAYGQTIVGATSGASYTVNSTWDEGGLHYLKLNIGGVGIFISNETITSSGGATATFAGTPKWIGDHGLNYVWGGSGKSLRINYADFSPGGNNTQELHNVAGFGPSRLGLYLGDGTSGKVGYKKIHMFMMVKFQPGFFKQNADGSFQYVGVLKFFDLCSGFTAPNYWGNVAEHSSTDGRAQVTTEYGADFSVFNMQGGGVTYPNRLFFQENSYVADLIAAGWFYKTTPFAGRKLTDNTTQYNDLQSFYLSNEWFGMEVAADLGTPNNSNGTFDFWIYDKDGKEKGHFTSTGENRLVQFDHFYNKMTLGGNRICSSYGTCPQGQDNRWYADDVIIHDSRIGPTYFSDLAAYKAGASDVIAPTISSFSMPTTSNSLSLAVSSLIATDLVGVTGYLIAETSSTPAPGLTGWSSSTPTTFSFSSSGIKTVYAWAKDAAGNVSASKSTNVTITLPDTTAPNITAFAIPATSSSFIISNIGFMAADNVNVTGYMLNEIATTPSSSNAGWSVTAPTSYSFTKTGINTLYAWAKDSAGNVSMGVSASITITLPDTTAPVISAFTIPATAATLSVAVSTLTATDNIGVTGYLITEIATAPAAGATGWSATVPTSFTFVAAGSKTAYAWAKDAAGNVSLSRSAAVTITLPDTTAPVVTAFSMPTTSTSLIVAVSSLTATDAVGVTGYLINSSATKPLASATGWSASVPTSVAYTTAGSKTAYAWAKDAAGNVSLSRSAAVTITLPDTTAPVVSAFTMPTTATTLTVAVSSLTATDAVGVTGYLINSSATKPLASATGWTASAPASVTYTTAGSKTAYAWAKDAAGNVSLSLSAVTTITLPDTTAPVVSAFMMPATSSFLTILVTTLTATDAVGVTGYLITESATAPSAGASGWSASVPTSIVFTTEGSKTAYAWARDAAGNVSLSRSAVVIIDTIAPAVSIGIRKDVSSLSGMLTVAATASDNLGVSGVEFYVNGTLVTTVLTAPYVFNWDSTAVANGSYTLTAKAYDVSGNIGQSASIRISVPSCKFR